MSLLGRLLQFAECLPRTGRGQVQIITVLSRKAFQQSSRMSKLVLQDPKFALKKF
jgi:hypothetical protein